MGHPAMTRNREGGRFPRHELDEHKEDHRMQRKRQPLFVRGEHTLQRRPQSGTASLGGQWR